MAEKVSTTPRKPPFTPRSIPPNTSSPPSASHRPLSNGDINPQPVLDPYDSLPTISGRRSECFLVEERLEEFLQTDLDLSRLNVIHDLLWMAGRPMRARPLHRYRMLGFELLSTQQMDLHLLKFSNRLMLKPLPEYMLHHEFWQQHLCEREKHHLYESACGWLLSYVWLLTSPLDLKIAHEYYLLPSFITWPWWKDFVRDFCHNIDINALDEVNKRYHFGELRLGRINSIYRIRFAFTHFVRGYLYGYNRYVVFFQRKFSWVLIVFVFFSLVLSAMQVGAGIDPLQENPAFKQACIVFVVFSMVAVAATLSSVSLLFIVIYIHNMIAAIRHDNKERKAREKKARDRKGVKEA